MQKILKKLRIKILNWLHKDYDNYLNIDFQRINTNFILIRKDNKTGKAKIVSEWNNSEDNTMKYLEKDIRRICKQYNISHNNVMQTMPRDYYI